MFVRHTQQVGDQPAVKAVSGRPVVGQMAGQAVGIGIIGLADTIGLADSEHDTEREGHKRAQQYRSGRFRKPAGMMAGHSRVAKQKQHLDTQLPGRQALGLTEPNMDSVPVGWPATDKTGAGGVRMV